MGFCLISRIGRFGVGSGRGEIFRRRGRGRRLRVFVGVKGKKYFNDGSKARAGVAKEWEYWFKMKILEKIPS